MLINLEQRDILNKLGEGYFKFNLSTVNDALVWLRRTYQTYFWVSPVMDGSDYKTIIGHYIEIYCPTNPELNWQDSSQYKDKTIDDVEKEGLDHILNYLTREK